jgi:NADPH:quinone reductase
VHRSGVNPTDWKARTGTAAGAPIDPPQVPNHDGAGVIDAVGPGVDTALVGRRVWTREAAHGRPEGTAQEQAILPESLVAELPERASFDLGASLGVPFVTAHRCLTSNDGGPQRLGPGALSGRVVLVTGGAGAVGNAAIQLARWCDATVLTTVSSDAKGRLAAAAGAQHVIDYTDGDVAAKVREIAPDGVHTVVEVAAATNGQFDVDVLAQGGTVAVYAGVASDTTTVPVRQAMTLNARWQFVLLYLVPEQAKRNAVADINAAIEADAIGVGEARGLPLHHFPLEQTADAHAAVEAGAVGKVLVDVLD